MGREWIYVFVVFWGVEFFFFRFLPRTDFKTDTVMADTNSMNNLTTITIFIDFFII